MTASLDGLTLQALRTKGFNPSAFTNEDTSKYYQSDLVLDGRFIKAWLEYKVSQEQQHLSPSPHDIFTHLEDSYEPEPDRKLKTYKEVLNNTLKSRVNKYNQNVSTYDCGIMSESWIDLPAWLITLFSLYKNKKAAAAQQAFTDDFQYFPLSASKTWYQGFSGAALEDELQENSGTIIYSDIFRKALGSQALELCDLFYAGAHKSMSQYSLWPRPLSGEVIKTWQGLRPSSYIPGTTGNLLTEVPGSLLPPVSARNPVNPVKSPDNYYLTSTTTVQLGQLISSLAAGTYTLSFYARYDYDVRVGDYSQETTWRTAVSFNSNGVTKSYPLYDCWKRYYMTFTLPANATLSNYSFTINTTANNVKVAGILLEKAAAPSPYIPSWHKVNAELQNFKTISPLLYQLPVTQAYTSGSSYFQDVKTSGTIIYSQYIEDHGQANAKHLSSLGFANTVFITWGFDENGHPVLKSGNTTASDSSKTLTGHEDSWMLNILTFNKTSATWTVYVKSNPKEAFSTLTITGLDLPASTCYVSALVSPNSSSSESAVSFNLALGSELRQGTETGTSASDPYNSWFSSAETEVGLPDGSVFQDLAYCTWQLSSDEILKLVNTMFYLKLQDTGNQTSELALIGSPINQSGYGRDYVYLKNTPV